MEVRPATINDLDAIVNIHINAFQGFFLTKMGKRFLKLYYAIVLSYKNSLTLVCVQENKTVGFVTGFFNPNGFYSYFSSQKKRFIIPIAISLAKNPKLIKRILYNFKRVRNITEKDNQIELSSIAVHADMQGKSIGKILLGEFIHESKKYSPENIYLTTDAENNEPVNRFYAANGFMLEKQYLSQDRLMNLYKLHMIE